MPHLRENLAGHGHGKYSSNVCARGRSQVNNQSRRLACRGTDRILGIHNYSTVVEMYCMKLEGIPQGEAQHSGIPPTKVGIWWA